MLKNISLQKSLRFFGLAMVALAAVLFVFVLFSGHDYKNYWEAIWAGAKVESTSQTIYTLLILSFLANGLAFILEHARRISFKVPTGYNYLLFMLLLAFFFGDLFFVKQLFDLLSAVLTLLFFYISRIYKFPSRVYFLGSITFLVLSLLVLFFKLDVLANKLVMWSIVLLCVPATRALVQVARNTAD